MKSKVYRVLLSLNHDRQLSAFAFKLKHIHLVSWESCKKKTSGLKVSIKILYNLTFFEIHLVENFISGIAFL